MPLAGGGPTLGVDTMTSPYVRQFDVGMSPLVQMSGSGA